MAKPVIYFELQDSYVPGTDTSTNRSVNVRISDIKVPVYSNGVPRSSTPDTMTLAEVSYNDEKRRYECVNFNLKYFHYSANIYKQLVDCKKQTELIYPTKRSLVVDDAFEVSAGRNCDDSTSCTVTVTRYLGNLCSQDDSLHDFENNNRIIYPPLSSADLFQSLAATCIEQTIKIFVKVRLLQHVGNQRLVRATFKRVRFSSTKQDFRKIRGTEDIQLDVNDRYRNQVDALKSNGLIKPYDVFEVIFIENTLSIKRFVTFMGNSKQQDCRQRHDSGIPSTD